MAGELTLVGGLVAAVTALAGAVGVLWRTSERRHEALEKRTESHLAVATKQTEVLALMDVRVSDVAQRLERIGADRAAQLDSLDHKLEAYHESDLLQHSGQMRALAAIEALLWQAERGRVEAVRPPRGDEAQ